MTLENLIETGSGRLAARWSIAGLSIEFCTEPGMEKTTSDGRRRLCVTSLDDCGFSIEEAVNIPEAFLEGGASSLILAETLDEDLSQLFDRAPTFEDWLLASVTDTDLVLTVYDGSGVSAGDVIHLGNEAVKVDSVAGNVITIPLGGRGYWDTIAQYAYTADTEGMPEMLVTDRPQRIRGRIARLYLYGDGDALSGDGTLVWTGKVREEPVLMASGMKYRLALGHVADILKTKIGSDKETVVSAAGIYYPASAGLRIQITEYSPSIVPYAYGLFVGFYATQTAFCTALTTWLAALAADVGLDSLYRAEPTIDGRWTLQVTVGSSTTSVAVHIQSEQDGETSIRAEDMLAADGERVGTAGALSPGDELFTNWRRGGAGARTVPRGFFRDSSVPQLHNGREAGTWVPSRIYVSLPPDSSWTAVTFEWPEAGGAFTRTGSPAHTYEIQSTGETDGVGWIVIRDDREAPAGGQGYTSGAPIRMSIGRTFALGNLADFRAALLVASPQLAGLGATPLVTSGELASWTAEVDASTPFGWQAVRLYAFSQSEDFEEFLAHEFRMLGLYPVTNSAGQIKLAHIRLPSAGSSVFDIDEEIATVDGQAVELSSMAHGNQTVNRVVFKWTYDPTTQEWGNEYEVQDRASYALDHEDRPLEIFPRSGQGSTPPSTMAEQVTTAFLPVLAFFGYPHTFVDVKVPWTCFNLRLGDAVTFSADHLPARSTGRRPLGSVYGTVVRRKWKLSEVYGELQVLLSWQNVAGYAPTARVTATNDLGGNQWELTVNPSLYLDSGDDFTNHFIALDSVRIWNIDTESATVLTGTVDACTSTVITVTFTGTFTPGSETWELGFPTYSNANEGQKLYAYYAGTDLRLGTSDPARTLGP